MTGILMWGTGLKDKAEITTPELLQMASLNWAFDIAGLQPWLEFSLLNEGGKSRCWISNNTSLENLLIIVGQCSSSLDLAWHFSQKGLFPEWSSLLALSQWAGRGQSGRMWFSPAGNLYGAWYLPKLDKPWSEMLSLIMGDMLIYSMRKLGLDIQLKWPNDLLMNRKKVGGILIEEKNNATIAGVGINLVSSPSKDMIRDEFSPSPISLKEFGIDFSPLKLWCKLMYYGRIRYKDILSCNTSSSFISQLQTHLAFMGEKVIVSDYVTEPYMARVSGLADNGGLKIQTEEKERVVRSGSIYPSQFKL